MRGKLLVVASGDESTNPEKGAKEDTSSAKPRRDFRPQSRARFSPEHRIVLDLLIQARKDANLTQRDLAARLGKVHSHVAAVELAERDVTGVEMIRWCSATGITFSEFAARYEARATELSSE